MRTFNLLEEHIKLLKKAWISWDDCEFGAPCIDPKRPYGNSDVISDIIEILFPEEIALYQAEDYERDLDTKVLAEELHQATQTALQVILASGSFEPGLYYADDYNINWKKAE